MKITNIHFTKYGPYRDWKFTPPEKGLSIIYGPNESGKTTFLQGMRDLIFGFKGENRKEATADMQFIRGTESYYLGREGKKLNFHNMGGEEYTKAPPTLWWHGLDRKTYEQIFAITLEDMQGVKILHSVDVRTRFFGSEEGEKVGEAVKAIEKAAANLLVSSANGKRKINRLLESLQELEEQAKEYVVEEDEYIRCRREIEKLRVTEKELKDSLEQWKEYMRGVSLVVQTWDTYKRAQESKKHMDTMVKGSLPEQERFLALDKEISQCQEYMRVWREKEESFIPEDFIPEDAIHLYSKEIEQLYEELARWEQLERECHQGVKYIQDVREQLERLRQMHHMWHFANEIIPTVDWAEGEKRSHILRRARENKEHWEQRKPKFLAQMEGEVPEDQLFYGRSLISSSPEEVESLRRTIDTLQEKFTQWKDVEEGLYPATESPTFSKNSALLQKVLLGFWLAATIAFFIFAGGLNLFSYSWAGGASVLVALLCLGASYYSRMHSHQSIEEQQRMASELGRLYENDCRYYNLPVLSHREDFAHFKDAWHLWEKAYYDQDREKLRQYIGEKENAQWLAEGKTIEEELSKAESLWEEWRPKESNVTCSAEHFFRMKEEYDAYKHAVDQYHIYKERVDEKEAELKALDERATELWKKLEIQEEPTPLGLRKLYNQLRKYQENKVKYEQKEAQRKSYREEYDSWHCKEKELRIEQEAIIQKSGCETATEFRRQLISLEQYRQWETIYNQSCTQLHLLAPEQDDYDLLTGRLREGDKEKWVKEFDRGHEQIQRLEQQLSVLYESIGQYNETMRRLENSRNLVTVLRKKEEMQAQLQATLKEWATQVYMMHCMETAQHTYEKEKQPLMMEMASHYLERLTEGKYHMGMNYEEKSVALYDENGKCIPLEHWSSGTADQVYLALRLSLAMQFAHEVEPLPLVLDDVLLRFDEQRQKAALLLLQELASHVQIFLFTCQEQTETLAASILSAEKSTLYRFETNGLQALSAK